MSTTPKLRRPVSTRHAFALAFDLSVRRDALQSLVLPLLLAAPWIVAQSLLPSIDATDRPGQVMLLLSVAAIGDFLVWIAVSAMIRVRARSVFNTPHAAKPASAIECYALGLRRAPWLVITEIVRNAAIGFATFFLVVPALFLSYRLAFATEAVVLNDANLSEAFGHSFRLSRGRFERWLEMIVVSVLLILGAAFVVAVLSLTVRDVSPGIWYVVFRLLTTALMPVIQYAWTFFYLRLVEVEDVGVEVGPLYASAAPEPEASPSAGESGSGAAPEGRALIV